jgi:hypothetical protein
MHRHSGTRNLSFISSLSQDDAIEVKLLAQGYQLVDSSKVNPIINVHVISDPFLGFRSAHVMAVLLIRCLIYFYFFLLRLGVCAASSSAYSRYPELWILRYPAHRCRAFAWIRTHVPLVESPTS